MENLLKKCGKDILIVFATKAADYNEKRVNEILAWNDRRIRVVRMEGEYDTFRKPVGRDYRSYSEAYELKEGEDEAKERKLDAEFVNVLKEFLGSCQM